MANVRLNELKSDVPPTVVSACFKNIPNRKVELALFKAVLVIDVVNNSHEAEFLDATLGLLNLYEDKINKLDVLIEGSLYRWHYWNFSQTLSEKKLEKLLSDIPDNLDVEGLAHTLARKFYPYAKQAEEDYIRKNSITFLTALPSKFRISFITWEKLVPISYAKETSDSERYELYRKQLIEKCAQDTLLDAELKRTFERMLNNRELILAQSMRIRNASQKLHHFTDIQLQEVAEICSYNFLLEKCVVLFAELPDRIYTSIISTQTLEEALGAIATVHRLVLDKPISWLPVSHEIIGVSNDDESSYSNDDRNLSPSINSTALTRDFLVARRKLSAPFSSFLPPSPQQEFLAPIPEDGELVIPMSPDGAPGSQSPLPELDFEIEFNSSQPSVDFDSSQGSSDEASTPYSSPFFSSSQSPSEIGEQLQQPVHSPLKLSPPRFKISSNQASHSTSIFMPVFSEKKEEATSSSGTSLLKLPKQPQCARRLPFSSTTFNEGSVSSPAMLEDGIEWRQKISKR